MKLKNRSPLGLEALEDRWVPATVRFDGTNLFVSNPTIVGGASTILVTETAANTFQVKDNGVSNGTFNVTGNISILGNNAKDNVIVNVSAAGFAGNLFVSTGNGPSSVTVDSNAAGGFVAGNTTINMGTGANSVWVGNKQGGGGVGITERGNLSVFSRGSGTNAAFVGGAANPTSVLGNTTLSNFPSAKLGAAADLFAGNVTVSNANNPLPGTITQGGAIAGNFTIQSSTGGSTTVTVANNVLGQLTLNLGSGTNSVALGSAATAVQIGGLNFLGGNGGNTFTAVAGKGVTVANNVNVNLGNGANALGPTAGLTVNGNVQLMAGNGGLDAAANSFQAAVFGNLNVFAGNGNNSFTFGGDKGAAVFGTFNYTGGNGGNNLTVNNTSANVVALNVRFGNNAGTGAAATSNVFTIGAGTTPGTLAGQVRWGIPTFAANGNAFIDNGYVWNSVVTLTNVPA